MKNALLLLILTAATPVFGGKIQSFFDIMADQGYPQLQISSEIDEGIERQMNELFSGDKPIYSFGSDHPWLL